MSDDDYGDDWDQSHNDFETSATAEEDADDEQHAQKVNGQVESLQTKVEQLERELQNERKRTSSPPKLERANSSFSRDIGSADAQAEARKYKKLYESLKEQNEINSLVSASTAQLPLELKQEFLKFCKKHNVYTDLREKEMTEANCIKILKSKIRAAPPPKSAIQDSKQDSADTQLQERIKGLEGELRLALGATEDIRALKAKLLQSLERIRLEKEGRLKVESDFASAKRKVEMLTDHMEKLMIHIKQGAAARDRVADQLHEQERQSAKLKERSELIQRKSAAKDRFILELREGSKVLEDQLRLMDEKYLELRTKLDYARDLGAKKVKRAEQQAKELRVKFALSNNASMMLDQVPLPPLGMSQSMDGDSWMSVMGQPQNSQQQLGPAQAMKRGKEKAQSAQRSRQSHDEFNSTGGGGSVTSGSFNDKPPDLDRIFEKIRNHGDEKREWSEDNLRKLAHGNAMSR